MMQKVLLPNSFSRAILAIAKKGEVAYRAQTGQSR
jgi:intraflagellar transport protein 122